MKKYILLFLVLLIPLTFASHEKNERYYQNIWCRENKGITEYILPDKTRVDCLTKEYAVEFDFAAKWAESVGQSLYYAKMTKKKPAIVLIMESNNDEKYFERAKTLSQSYDIALFKMKSKDYINYKSSNDMFSEIIAYIKNLIKIFLINIVDKI